MSTHSLGKFSPKILREHILYMAMKGQSVHIPCAFSIVEIVSVLYDKILKYNPKDPCDPDRDYLILSKGHGVMALYAVFRELGWIEQKDLDEYFSDGSKLHGLCESHIPGLEVTSGSLGHGLPIAVGIAFGLKRLKSQRRVYCIVGDGEMNEGSMWEALMFASQHKLANLTIIVDANGYQAMGETKDILDMQIQDKLYAFGCETYRCNGHKMDSLGVFLSVRTEDRPIALVALTTKGKGVSFMENDNAWHYTRLTEKTYQDALRSL